MLYDEGRLDGSSDGRADPTLDATVLASGRIVAGILLAKSLKPTPDAIWSRTTRVVPNAIGRDDCVNVGRAVGTEERCAEDGEALSDAEASVAAEAERALGRSIRSKGAKLGTAPGRSVGNEPAELSAGALYDGASTSTSDDAKAPTDV